MENPGKQTTSTAEECLRPRQVSTRQRPVVELASAEQPAPRRELSRLMLYLGFAATGICMALPGSVLPALLERWSLPDSRAGLLFFMAWIGSSAGALLVRLPFSRSLSIGALLLTIACLGIAFQSRAFGWACFAWMILFGLGLGITMTATSLLRAARNAAHRGLELNRLNLVWSLGACFAPTLAGHSLRIVDVRSIFASIASFFALLFVWTAVFERDSSSNRPASESGASQFAGGAPRLPRLRLLWPISLLCVIFLPTGIESSMGAWTASYVLRSGATIGTTITAGTCFWGGLMLSRILSSFLLKRRRAEGVVLRQSLLTVVVGLALLAASGSSSGILLATSIIGFGLGPIYPILLAIALEYSTNTAIFFVAGLGSAFIPWFTGVVSSRANSLRIGLEVPLTASIFMMGLGLWILARRVPERKL